MLCSLPDDILRVCVFSYLDTVSTCRTLYAMQGARNERVRIRSLIPHLRFEYTMLRYPGELPPLYRMSVSLLKCESHEIAYLNLYDNLHTLHIEIPDGKEESLPIEIDFPPTLTNLTIGYSPPVDKVEFYEFPQSVHTLTLVAFPLSDLGDWLDHRPALTSLTLRCWDYDWSAPKRPLPEGIPASITSLQIADRFNHPLEGALKHLQALRALHLSNDFNAPLEADAFSGVQETLETLSFGSCFNKPVHNAFRCLTNLTSLTFHKRGYFNQPVLPWLPLMKSLRTLIFGNQFNQPVEDVFAKLPVLHTLCLGREFNHPILALPQSLRVLRIGVEVEYGSFDRMMKYLLRMRLWVVEGAFRFPLPPVPEELEELTLPH